MLCVLAGMLVWFSRGSRVSARHEPAAATPRSLSAVTSLSFGGNLVGSYPRYALTGSTQDTSDSDNNMGFYLPDRVSTYTDIVLPSQ